MKNTRRKTSHPSGTAVSLCLVVAAVLLGLTCLTQAAEPSQQQLPQSQEHGQQPHRKAQSSSSTTSSSSTSMEGWSDNYKMDYSYDSLSDNGPATWGNLEADSTLGWGEWEAVRRTSSAAAYTSGQETTPLLTWGRTTPNQCGSETKPSPIELIPSATCSDTVELRVRPFNSVDCRHPVDDTRQEQDVTGPWDMTPYSLRYYFPRTDRSCRRPTLRLDQVYWAYSRKNDNEEFQEHFVLLWLELHARSEHVVHGKRYDAELQMVHMGTTRPDELLIVSVLIDSSSVNKDHVDFQRYLLDGWQRKALQQDEDCNARRNLRRGHNDKSPWAALHDYQQARNETFTSVDYYHEQLQQQGERKLQGGGGGGGGGGDRNKCEADKYGNGCQSLGLGPRKRAFPYNLWPSMWYYSYEGSLTAPPCTGKVHWRIIDTPLTISRRQYKQLTHLLKQSRDDKCRLDTATDLQGENFRPLQMATMSASGGTQVSNNNNDKQGNNQDNNDDQDSGPQVVSHCTSDNFFVEVVDEDEQ